MDFHDIEVVLMEIELRHVYLAFSLEIYITLQNLDDHPGQMTSIDLLYPITKKYIVRDQYLILINTYFGIFTDMYATQWLFK